MSHFNNQRYSNYEICDMHEVALTCLPKFNLILDVMLINGQMWVSIIHKFEILWFFEEDLHKMHNKDVVRLINF